MIPSLTAEQQQEFDALVAKMERTMRPFFKTIRNDSFFDDPMKNYALVSMVPHDKRRSRAHTRRCVECALHPYSSVTTTGRTTSLTDTYTVGSFAVIVSNARNGGRIVTFELIG